MMDKTKTPEISNPPAFPLLETAEFNSVNEGMTLRDYFAAKAMAAIISKVPLTDSEGEHGIKVERSDNLKLNEDVSESAYYYADAMLAAREEGGK